MRLKQWIVLLGVISSTSTVALAQVPGETAPQFTPTPSEIGPSLPSSTPETEILTPPVVLPTVVPAKLSAYSFNPQFGIGLTGILASGVLYKFDNDAWSYYYGGVQLDFLWKLHPRLTLEFSPGVLISDTQDQNSNHLIEFPFSLGLRVNLRALPTRFVPWFVMPYAAAAFQMNFLLGAGPTYDAQSLYGYYTVPPSLYLGANLGIGIELPITQHFALHADVRGFAQGAADVNGYEVYFPPRIGLRFGVGFAGYF